MKKIICLLSLFSFVSCNPLINFFKQNDTANAPSLPLEEEVKSDSMAVYFEETDEFFDIPSVNQDTRALKLFDQFVFSNEEYFRDNKNKQVEIHLTDSSPSETFKSPFKFNVFCDSSKEELSKKEDLRQNYKLELASVPSHLSVVRLIPESFLSQNLDRPFYCSFIFQVQSKNYILIQQKLDPLPSNNSLFSLSLLRHKDSGRENWDKKTVLTKKELPLVSIADSTGQGSEYYELYCEGNKISSVSSAISEDVVFSKLLDLEDGPSGIQSCRLFSKNKNQIVGISHAFQLDFDDLSYQAPATFPEIIPDSPAVYFEETDEFLDIPSVNQDTRALKLFDRFVFSDEEYFRKHKTEEPEITLTPSSKIKASNAPFKFNVFCDFSKEQLEKKAILRKNYELELPFIPSNLSVVRLIPKSFLSQLDNPFYCNFIFQVNSKPYILLKRIDSLPYNHSLFALSLLRHKDSGRENLNTKTSLTKKDIPLVSIADSTGQKPEYYELYCEGNKISSVSSAVSSEVNVSKLLDLENWPAGIQSCRLFSKKKNRITGISSFFKINFDDLSYQAPKIDLKTLKTPKFRLRNGLTGYVEFSGLDDHYKSIDIKTQTECVYMDQEADLMDSQILSKTTVQPLQKKLAVMSITPENAFIKLGIHYDYWLYRDRLLSFEYSLQEDNIGKNQVSEEWTLPWWVREYELLHAQSTMDYDFDVEDRRIENSRIQLLCIYKIKLEDQNNPSHSIDFNPIVRIIKWKKDKSRSGYGVGFVALNDQVVKTPFFTNKDLKTLQKEALSKLSGQNKDRQLFKPLMYKDSIDIDELIHRDYFLRLSYFDQDNSAKNTDIHRVALKCYKEGFDEKPLGSVKEDSFQLKEKSWSIDHFPSDVSLTALLSDPEIKDFITVGHKALIVCRVLFYSQYKATDFLKYFSSEIRFTN